MIWQYCKERIMDIETIKNGNKEYRQINIQEMQSWSLDKKINHALKRIKEFYIKMDGKVYISFSGGKDSCVLKHLVESLYPSVISVFSNTTNEYSEILDHVRNSNNVVWVNPKMTFNDTVESFGFPLVGKMVARKVNELRDIKSTNENTRRLYDTGFNSKGEYHYASKLSDKWKYLVYEDFNITNKCCDILKKEPFKRFEKETGLSPYIGTQASESELRKKNWVDSGCNIISESKNASRPLSIWDEKDIWEYIVRFNVPYSRIYDGLLDKNGNKLVEGEKRTGCAYCAFGADQEKSDLYNKNRFERLSLRKPKQFKKMMLLENNGVTFREALNKIGVRT